MGRIAKVVLNIGVDRDFDYFLPDGLKLKKGSRVLVEFGRAKRVGIVVAFSKHSAFRNVKTIIKALDTYPSFSDEKLKFAKKLAKDLFYPLGQVAFMMLPSYLRLSKAAENKLSSPCAVKKGLGFSVKFIRKNTFQDRFGAYKDDIIKTLKANSVFLCFPVVSQIEEACKLLDKDLLERAVVIHSYQTPKVIYANWLKIKEGKKLILGTRLALFYYPDDLGLVIAEGEASQLYLQEEKPYYNLIDAAWLLCNIKKIKLILSGDYPSLYSYKKYKKNKILLEEEQDVIKNIEIFDLKNFYYKRRSIFKPFVVELMRKNLEDNKRLLIVWERKNYSTILRCDKCGHVFRCARCSSPLKLSLKSKQGLCSWCGYKEHIEEVCNICKDGYIKPVGVGIERLENMVRNIFPEYEVKNLREASPSTKIILSTSQIVTHPREGVPNIDSVFVLDADNLLSQMNYEATFDTFIYLKRISNLAKDNIYVFTYNTQHYIWANILKNYKYFYDHELSFRKKLKFPPYVHMVKVTLRSKNKNSLLKRAQSLYNRLKAKHVEVFGPLEEIPFKLRDNYRYSVIGKFKDKKSLTNCIEPVISSYRRGPSKLAVVIK